MRKALKNKLSGLMRSLLRSSQRTILIFSIYLFIYYYCKKKTIHFPISSGRLWVFTLSSFSSWTPSNSLLLLCNENLLCSRTVQYQTSYNSYYQKKNLVSKQYCSAMKEISVHFICTALQKKRILKRHNSKLWSLSPHSFFSYMALLYSDLH